MSTRSLFSPFSSSVSPHAARNIGNLFRPKDDLELSPELIALLGQGVDASPEMFMASQIFKDKGANSREANARVKAGMVSAKFGEDLRNRSERQMIPFRANTELEKQKELGIFKRKQEKEIEEESLGELGTALGPQLGNLPTEDLSNIIPQGTVFGSPAEQARSYMAKVGDKTPVSKAVVETNPAVIKGRIGAEANQRFTKMGDVLYDTQTGEFSMMPRDVSETSTELIETNEMVPSFDTEGNYIGQVKKQVPRTTSTSRSIPGTRGFINIPTQEGLDKYPKKSGADANGVNPQIGPQPDYNSTIKAYISPNSTIKANISPMGQEHNNIKSPLNTITAPKGPSTELPGYTGGIPTVLGAIGDVNKAITSYPMKLNTMLANNMENLIPSKEVQPLVDNVGEGIYGAGEGLNRIRQALMKRSDEKTQPLTARDPLSLYLDTINKGLTTGGGTMSEILQGIMSPSPDTKPLMGKPKKKAKKDYRNFDMGDDFRQDSEEYRRLRRNRNFSVDFKPTPNPTNKGPLNLEGTPKQLELKGKVTKDFEKSNSKPFATTTDFGVYKELDKPFQKAVENSKSLLRLSDYFDLDKKQKDSFKTFIEDYVRTNHKEPSHPEVLKFLKSIGK